jgi:hypothetical protein
MIQVAVRVLDEGWDRWLDAVGETSYIRELEVSASVLASAPGLRSRMERAGLTVCHVRDLLPPDVARYLFESPLRASESALAHLRDMLRLAHEAGAASMSMDLGLGRIQKESYESDLAARMALVRELLKAMPSVEARFCIPVRHPPGSPASSEWPRAANLIYEVANPACRMLVNVFPSELPDDFDVAAFVRGCHLQIAAVRFHYEPALGEDLVVEQQQAWAHALHWHGFGGVVAFCPRVLDPEASRLVCRRLDEVTPLYRAAAPKA